MFGQRYSQHQRLGYRSPRLPNTYPIKVSIEKGKPKSHGFLKRCRKKGLSSWICSGLSKEFKQNQELLVENPLEGEGVQLVVSSDRSCLLQVTARTTTRPVHAIRTHPSSSQPSRTPQHALFQSEGSGIRGWDHFLLLP